MNVSFWGIKKHEKESFLDILRRIKSGDRILKEKFIQDYKPFIIKSLYQATGRIPNIESSDEYSIGLVAFNEAIEKFNEEKNCSFKSFSQQVIKRRLIDYKRSNQKNDKVYPFSYFEFEEGSNFEEHYLAADHHDHVYNFEVKEEFSSLLIKLEEFGLSIKDLISSTPKQKKSKQTCIKIARIIAQDQALFAKFNKKRTIPYSKLVKRIDVSQRTIERNRKYIIALVLILNSDLDVLKNYIDSIE
ncbi:MAG: RNA polymerase sigma-I factor [Clostridium sp.]|nr:RNA polymerase sigma-I factor [Clostridium sp.]